MPEMSGYNLVQQILAHPNGSLEKLLSLAGNGECDWLELKAAVITRPQDRKPNENEADAQWHVAEAVIAMANSRGGIVLVGINDKDKSVVPLCDADPKRIIETQGAEAYRRIMIHDGIDPAYGAWRTGCKGSWRLDAGHLPHGLFSVIGLNYQDQEIAGILVQPVPEGGECIRTWKGEVECILHRTMGQIGRVETLVGSKAMAAYQKARKSASEDLAALWEQFQRDHNLSPELEDAIEAWHKRFRNSCKDLLVSFTPLDAVEQKQIDDFETPVPREAFEPCAEECLPDYLEDGAYEDDTSADDYDEGETEENEEDDIGRPARKGGLFSLLAEESRAVVLGEPGAGKTTCLRRLALDAVQLYQPGGTVALFIPLTLLGKTGDLWQLIHDRTGLNPAHVETLIGTGRCQLFLDALNECPDSLRPALTTSIEQIIRRHPDLPVIISSRTANTTAALHLPTFTIEPLNDDQRRTFLAAYLRNPAQAEILLQRLNEQPGGSSLAANPLLLRMIVEVARTGGNLPHGRAGLYRRWLDDWYAREARKARVAGTPLPWSALDTRRALAAIAFAARKTGLRIADTSMALEALSSTVVDADAFLARMTQGPLLTRLDDHIHFRHETFQEYLSAEHLARNPKLFDSITPGITERWSMTLAYLVELWPEPGPAILVQLGRLDPWIAACFDNPRALLCSRDVESMVSRDLRPWFKVFLGGEYTELEFPTQSIQHWPTPALRYALNISEGSRTRWQGVEDRLFRLAVSRNSGQMLALIYSHNLVVSPNALARNFPRGMPRRLLAMISPEDAAVLAEHGVIIAGHLGMRQIEWEHKTTISQKRRLIATGLLEPVTEIEGSQKPLRNRESNLADKTHKMHVTHRVLPLEFKNRKQELVSLASISDACHWVEAKICAPLDFRDKVPSWTKRTEPADAIALVSAGICSPEDFGILNEILWALESDAKTFQQLRNMGMTDLDPE